tara:strand:- start:263 stop:457 length:195 start_codon:yes stop_codon:yes gene_type:complete
MTTYVDPLNSPHVGHETFFISKSTSEINDFSFLIILIPSFRNINSAGVAGIEPATPGFGDRCST